MRGIAQFEVDVATGVRLLCVPLDLGVQDWSARSRGEQLTSRVSMPKYCGTIWPFHAFSFRSFTLAYLIFISALLTSPYLFTFP